MVGKKFAQLSIVGLSLLSTAGLSACGSDCEATKSCGSEDDDGTLTGDGDGDGDSSGDGDGDGDGDSSGDGDGDGDGDSSGDGDGDGDGDSSGDGDGNGDGDSGGDGDSSGDGDSMLPECGVNELLCDGACVDPRSDITFCGAVGDCTHDDVGEECESGWTCGQGRCQPVCDEDWVACDGVCIDPTSDERHCGAANQCVGRPDEGQECASIGACLQGACATWSESQIVPVSGQTQWLAFLPNAGSNASLLVQNHITDEGRSLFLSSGPSWEPPEDPLFSTPGQFQGWSFQHLATGQNEDALMVLVEGEETRGGPYFGVRAFEFGSVSGPGSSTLVSTDYQRFLSLSATLSTDGTALAAWVVEKDSEELLQLRLRTNADDWLDTETLAESEDGAIGDFEVISLENGQVIIVWEQEQEAGQASWALDWAGRSQNGQFEPTLPAATMSERPLDLALFGNQKGSLYLSWAEEGSTPRLRLMHFENNAWHELSADHPALAQATELQAFVLENGDLLVFASLSDSLDVHQYSLERSEWLKWESPVPNQGPVWDVQGEMDAAGNLFIAYWSETTDSTEGLHAARFDAETRTWSEPFVLETLAAGNAVLDVFSNGQAAMAWTREGENQPFVRRFE